MAAVSLPATLTLAQASPTLRALQAGLDGTAGGGVFEVDAQAMAEFDTSALAVLLEVRRMAQARGLALSVVQAPPKLRQLAQLYGVQELLALQPSA